MSLINTSELGIPTPSEGQCRLDSPIEQMSDHDLLVELVTKVREAEYVLDNLITSLKENPMLASMGLFE